MFSFNLNSIILKRDFLMGPIKKKGAKSFGGKNKKKHEKTQ